MTTSEHLQRIKAKCESLLELAAKRTPGKWDCVQNVIETRKGDICIARVYARDDDGCDMPTGTFIASCAGPAEAGWRATIAAIDGFQRLSKWNFPGWEGDHGIISEIEGEIDAILAAWPEELL